MPEESGKSGLVWVSRESQLDLEPFGLVKVSRESPVSPRLVQASPRWSVESVLVLGGQLLFRDRVAKAPSRVDFI